jgi:hypothetical protein
LVLGTLKNGESPLATNSTYRMANELIAAAVIGALILFYVIGLKSPTPSQQTPQTAQVAWPPTQQQTPSFDCAKAAISGRSSHRPRHMRRPR